MKIEVKEVLRYAGAYKSDNPKMVSDVKSVMERLDGKCQPSSVYAVFDLERNGGDILLRGTDIVLRGDTVNMFLNGAQKVFLIAATLSPYSDIVLAEETQKSPYFGLLADAYFTAEIEAYLDEKEEELKNAYPELSFSRRFSAGYGDFPICFQKQLLQQLNAESILGIKLVDGSFMMRPNKSVTALIGAKIKGEK